MSGFITEEDLKAGALFESRHPIKFGQEGVLERALIFLGLNPIFSHPSDEKILRMYRLENGKISRGKYWTMKICDVLDYVGLGDAVRWLNFLDYDDAKERATLDVINQIPYGR